MILMQRCSASIFLSTLSLRRATTLVQIIISGYARISIHALLAESDASWFFAALKGQISIHALLAESDNSQYSYFLFYGDISIHALLAESDTPARMSSRLLLISIHALLAESDIYEC